MTAFTSNPDVSKEDARNLIRSITDTHLSNNEIDRWIDSQKFLSKYVDEKQFIDTVEKNAAYMDLWQTKSVRDLYENPKIDIDTMTSKMGSIEISKTNLIWNNTLSWINDLMNCRVEIWDNVFNRTIMSPDGQVIAKNVPLHAIEGTLQEIGRFYSIWLGKLAPYMDQIHLAINKNRPDKITSSDGGFEATEDTKFLKVFATMLYGPESLPSDLNIPNLVKVFNQVDPKKDPVFILRQRWILTETGGVNTILLENELWEASRKI